MSQALKGHWLGTIGCDNNPQGHGITWHHLSPPFALSFALGHLGTKTVTQNRNCSEVFSRTVRINCNVNLAAYHPAMFYRPN